MPMRIALLIVMVLVLPHAVAAQTVTVTSSSAPEAKLASIDENSPVLKAALIQRYARALDSLENRCQQTRTRVADMIVASRNSLRTEYRKDISLLGFLQAAARMMDESELTNQDCVQTFTLLVVALGQG